MFRFTEKRTKIIIFAIAATILVLAAGCFIAFHSIFHYNPDKTELEITAIRKNFLERSEIKLDGNKLSYHGGEIYSDGTGSGISKFVNLSDAEVREVFRYVVKEKMLFLALRDFSKAISYNLSESKKTGEEIAEPLTDYLIIVKYNKMEKLIGGENAVSYYKISDLYYYLNDLAEEQFGPSYQY